MKYEEYEDNLIDDWASMGNDMVQAIDGYRITENDVELHMNCYVNKIYKTVPKSKILEYLEKDHTTNEEEPSRHFIPNDVKNLIKEDLKNEIKRLYTDPKIKEIMDKDEDGFLGF